MRIAVSCFLLLLTTGPVCGAQSPAGDSAIAAQNTRTGNWSATRGTQLFTGTWTALPDSAHRTVTGTWMLKDTQGKTVMYGAWSAIKATDQWVGNWRAVVAERGGEYTGSFTSAASLKATTEFGDLFEKAVESAVSGTWRAGGDGGAWSIRAAAKSPPSP